MTSISQSIFGSLKERIRQRVLQLVFFIDPIRVVIIQFVNQNMINVSFELRNELFRFGKEGGDHGKSV